MVISADTSFLFSLYGHDSKTPKVLEWNKQSNHPIRITQLNRFELINSLRFAECRSFIAVGNAELFAAQFRFDLAGGRLTETNCDLADVFTEANRLSLAHTLTGGHRGFDILHVAAAKLIRATHFLTFDANQKKLAEKEGLIVPF